MSRVYIGGLNYRAKERDVEKLVRRYGRVREISLKNGFCFVEFDDYRDADDAVYELNGTEFMGERVSVEIAKGTPHGRDRDRWGTGSSSRRGSSPSRSRRRDDDDDDRRKPVWMEKYGPPTRTDFRLIIENLSSRVSWQDLKDYMRQAGDVCYADAHRTKRNEGTVEFATYKDMKNALTKLNDTELNGRRIRLIEDTKRRRRSSRSRSGTRSRSRSKSRSPRRSKSRSKSKDRSKSRSKSPAKDGKNGAKSKHDSRSRSRSRSRSPARRRSRSDSRSPARKSRSRSPVARKERNGGGSDKERSDDE